MAAPNLKAPTVITGKTLAYNCTATLASVLSNGASSGEVFKINTIRACNIDGVNSSNIDITLFRSSTHSYITYQIPVPAQSSLIVLSKEEYLYLEEGDALYAKATSASQITLTISYEDITG
jgi:hypothetical protein